MTKLESYLSKNKSLNVRKLSEGKYKIGALGARVKLIGECSNTSIDMNIISNTGNSLYPVNESFNSTDSVISKLDEILDIFNKASLVEANDTEDFEREDETKELLLDAEIPEESPEITNEITSLDELRNIIADIAERSTNLVDIFGTDKPQNRAIIIGVLSALYGILEDLDEFIEDLEEEEESEEASVEESVAIAGKTSYIDLASNGLSQAKYAMEKLNKYSNIIPILEDIRSEILTNSNH